MINRNEPLPYEQYYIAFLDVLGFSELVESEFRSDQLQISGLLNRIDKIQERFEPDYGFRNTLSLMCFSDSIIILGKCDISDIENNLKIFTEICIAAGNIQLEIFRMRGIWMRGGISVGGLYLNDKKMQIVGPAFVSAVKLEQEAKVPRIIIDPKIVHKLQMNSEDELIIKTNALSGLDESEYGNWKSDILFNRGNLKQFIDQDLETHKDKIFIDIFSRLLEDPIGLENLDPILLQHNIEKGLHSRYAKKYEWIFNQLTYVINSKSKRKNRYTKVLKYLSKIQK